jgi:hypothetical protein
VLEQYRGIKHFTAQNLADIFVVIKDHKLPCTLTTTGYGFGRIALVIYDTPLYPGVTVNQLLLVDEQCLNPDDFPWVKRPSKGEVHPEAWELFATIVETDENIARLKFYGLEIPKGIKHFSY